MTSVKAQLEKDLVESEERIKEQEKRIPPHSVRPHQIEELERLEDERDRILERLKALDAD